MLNVLRNVMNQHPIAGPILSAGVLSFVGDTLAQQWIERRGWQRHNWQRTLHQTFYGLCIIGPATCIWYRILEARVIHQNLLMRTFQRVCLDQLLFTPIFLAVYFLFNAAVEGASRTIVAHKFEKSYLPALVANYKLWPAVQFVNFYLVPLNFRLLFVNVIAVGWCAYLSNLNSRHAIDRKM